MPCACATPAAPIERGISAGGGAAAGNGLSVPLPPTQPKLRQIAAGTRRARTRGPRAPGEAPFRTRRARMRAPAKKWGPRAGGRGGMGMLWEARCPAGAGAGGFGGPARTRERPRGAATSRESAPLRRRGSRFPCAGSLGPPPPSHILTHSSATPGPRPGDQRLAPAVPYPRACGGQQRAREAPGAGRVIR